MKRIFWILFLALAVLGKSFAQEEGDDFFEEEEPPPEAEMDFQPPPPVNPEEERPDVRQDSRPESINRRGFRENTNRFSRPSLPSFNRNGGGSYGGSSDGEFEFKLVDPPAYKKKKSRLNIPPNVRDKVNQRIKAAERTIELKAGEDK